MVRSWAIMLNVLHLKQSGHYFQVTPAHCICQPRLLPMLSALSIYYRTNHKWFDMYLNPINVRAQLIFAQQEGAKINRE